MLAKSRLVPLVSETFSCLVETQQCLSLFSHAHFFGAWPVKQELLATAMPMGCFGLKKLTKQGANMKSFIKMEFS